MSRFVIACFALAFLAACDTGSAEGQGGASGRVVSLSTGAPLAGLSVQIREPRALPTVFQRGMTDADGRFDLPPAETDAFIELVVNEDPYDPSVYSWTSSSAGVEIGRDMEIGLWEIAELVVYAETDVPLGDGDRFFIDTPCVGSSRSPVEAGCARGNTENEITFTVTRDGERTTDVRQVFAPLGERTEVRFRY